MPCALVFIDTEMHASGGEPNRVDRVRAFVPMKRGGLADDVALAVVWLLSEKASFTTGGFIAVTGGKQVRGMVVTKCETPADVGHILFTPVVVSSHGRRVVGMGLAPMAVRPDCQRQGIGSQLVRHGLKILAERGCSLVVVVGHAEYYPRFGFERASRHGLASQWEGMPDEAFMVTILDQPSMTGVRGVARYRDEFNQVG